MPRAQAKRRMRRAESGLIAMTFLRDSGRIAGVQWLYGNAERVTPANRDRATPGTYGTPSTFGTWFLPPVDQISESADAIEDRAFFLAPALRLRRRRVNRQPETKQSLLQLND